MVILFYYKDKKFVNKELDRNIIYDLYYQKARLPKDKELKKIKKDSNYLKEIKDSISKIDDIIPLFDPFSNNIYMITKGNLYYRIFNDHYRFPNKKLINNLNNQKNELIKEIGKENIRTEDINFELDKMDSDYYKKHDIIFKRRKLRKLELMLLFMNNYTLEILKNTYVNAIYYESLQVGKDITLCKRPSFLPHFKHIKPFYGRSELINLGLNAEIIKSDKKTIYRDEKLDELCKKIQKYDISSNTILSHQNHIMENKKIGVIQYYTFMGAYFINKYLRNDPKYSSKNEILEGTTNSMYNLIRNAPAFDDEYVVYRFIQDDDYLYGLKEGDNHVENSFISTTRDPFYTVQEFKFGFILLKIIIPKKMIGCGLCVESYSNFPNEEEIILPPGTIMNLEKKDQDTIFYHTDPEFTNKVTKRYQFRIVGHKDLEFPKKEPTDRPKLLDFLNLDMSNTNSYDQMVSHFINNHLNQSYQFNVKIGDDIFTLSCEWFNSTTVYKKFYYSEQKNGFSILLLDKGNIYFMIELGEDKSGYFMYVNYYSRHSNVNEKDIKIEDQDFIKFIAELAYYFKINKVLIFSSYKSADIESSKNKYLGGRYCEDFYNYLKYNKKKYYDIGIERFELKPAFDYFLLDKLKRVSPDEILRKTDQDELYQIHKKIFSPLTDNDTLNSFYLWIVDNHSYLINELEKKMYRYYKNSNPFNKNYYLFNAGAYLYNRGLISQVPFELKKDDYEKMELENLPRNEYRINFSSRNNDR